MEKSVTENRPRKKYEAFGEFDGDMYWMEADDLNDFKDFINELDWCRVRNQESGTPVD